MTLVGEHLPESASVALGIWVRAGSRDEAPGREGVAHCVEHMLFKGTANRSAREIALSLERVGGYFEAFTTKESTCFYARTLAEDQGLAAEVLSDLVSRPLFAEADLERERGVILEELNQVEDTPEELVADVAMARLWPGHVMGSSILGTSGSIQRMAVDWIESFHQSFYTPDRIVIGAVGNVNEDRLQAVFDKHLALPAPGASPGRTRPPAAPPELTWIEKNSAQLYVSLATEAPAKEEPDRHAVQLLVDILGGGMSSRLFQSIREDLGLVYTIQAYSEHFEDTGMMGITLCVSPDHTEEAMERLAQEMARMADQGPTPSELEAAKAAAKGAILMGRESHSQRMLSLAGMEAEGRWYESVDDMVQLYERVSLEDVARAAASRLSVSDYHFVVAGPGEAKTLQPFRGRTIQAVEA